MKPSDYWPLSWRCSLLWSMCCRSRHKQHRSKRGSHGTDAATGGLLTCFLGSRAPPCSLQTNVFCCCGKGCASVTTSVLAALSCSTVCYPTDCSPPDPSVHGLLQAWILVCVVIPFSGGSFRPRDQTWISCMIGRFFTIWVTRETWAEHFWIPKFICWNPNPPCDGIWRWGLLGGD